jgi:hypothetical protein
MFTNLIISILSIILSVVILLLINLILHGNFKNIIENYKTDKLDLHIDLCHIIILTIIIYIELTF